MSDTFTYHTPMPPKTDRCGVTGKVRIRSRHAAADVLSKLQSLAAEDPRRREERAYHCVSCGGWHLTSQPIDPS